MLKLTTEIFIKKAILVHSNFYSYKKAVYTKSKQNIIITCSLHGDFKQTPNNHLNGQKCPSCGEVERRDSKRKSTEQFIAECNKVHSSKYIYTSTEYISSDKKVVITCNKHGSFKQTAYNHLQGQGCSKCGREAYWSRTDYIRRAKNRICTFYILRCFNEGEEFYKIGVTMNSIKKRYSHVSHMPYFYEIISEIKGEAGAIWDLELQEKRKLKAFHYLPNIEFSGSKNECFTKIKI
jgi:uncharacterized OB-fold protein